MKATGVGDYNRISVSPVTGTIGAEVGEVDLRDLDDETLAEINDAWMAHKVLFFRDQELTRDQHVAYGRTFGDLEVHPFSLNAESHPEILVLESTPEAFTAAESWHSDVTFREAPALGSVLIGRVIPPYGGDTCWTNMELAYDLLADDIKEEIEGRSAIHSYVKAFGRSMSPEQREKAAADFPEQLHPIVRTHPVTGVKSLFINPIFTLTIDGMTPAESRELRHQLYRQTAIPEIQCRLRWNLNSVAQWDNRCTQHYAIPDYGGHSRRVERVTILGDRPF